MKKKSELKRFLINNRVRYAVWALLFMPVLTLFSQRISKTDYFYQYALPILLVIILFALACGKSFKSTNKETLQRRYKYRYVFVVVSIFVHNVLYALLDYYYYSEDYLTEIIFANLFYPLLCSPVMIARTAYTRGLDLLDYFYRNSNDGFFSSIIAIVILFYVTSFSLLYVGRCLGINNKIFRPGDTYGFALILLVIIELALLFIIHIILCRTELKRYGKIDYK